MIDTNQLMFLCGEIHLAEEIVSYLNALRLGQEALEISHINFSRFPDGELDNRIQDYKNIRDKVVILSMSTNSDQLVLSFLDLLYQIKHHGAKKIIVIMPFMRYRRQDHPENEKEVHRNLQFIEMMKAHGVDHLILCDPHSEQIAINCKKSGITPHVTDLTSTYFTEVKAWLKKEQIIKEKFYVYSPDEGSIARAVPLAKALNALLAVTLKLRLPSGRMEIITTPSSDDLARLKTLSAENNINIIFADERLKGTSICMREDELSTASTARSSAEFLIDIIGVTSIILCVTHAVLVDGWKRKVGDPNDTPFNQVFCGNTIYRDYKNRTGGAFRKVSVAKPIAHMLHEVLNSL